MSDAFSARQRLHWNRQRVAVGVMQSTTPAHRVIGLALGDAAGIGPEVVAGALASGRLDPAFEYRVLGASPVAAVAGKPDVSTARAAWAALEEAARAALAGEVAAVVTGPVCKHGLYEAGYPYPGQTEFFAARSRTADFAMLLTGGALTVALVSAHLSLADAVRRLSTAEIVRVGLLLSAFLRRRLDRAPRIAVAGLNPHAGEQGALGREEIERIEPAVAELRRRLPGDEITGPVSPDTVFHHAAKGRHDAVLCMYHDQGLIPLKLHAFDEGVNVTIGLPIIRTSPDHGTAFDLAGKGLANPGSMIAAIRLATELAQKRP